MQSISNKRGENQSKVGRGPGNTAFPNWYVRYITITKSYLVPAGTLINTGIARDDATQLYAQTAVHWKKHVFPYVWLAAW